MIVSKSNKSYQTMNDFPDENWLVQFAEQGIDIGMTAEEAETAFNGKTWESLADNNVWEPGVIGTESLWKEVA